MRRAHATDRLKTEEELAAEEAARLETLEKNRLARMRGESVQDPADDAGRVPIVSGEIGSTASTRPSTALTSSTYPVGSPSRSRA